MTVAKGLGARTRTKHFGTRQRGDVDYKHMRVKEEVETIRDQGRQSDRWHMRKGKGPETRGELGFQNKTGSYETKKPKTRQTSPRCDKCKTKSPTHCGQPNCEFNFWLILRRYVGNLVMYSVNKLFTDNRFVLEQNVWSFFVKVRDRCLFLRTSVCDESF